MNKTTSYLFIISIIFLLGCTTNTFEDGLLKLEEVDTKFRTSSFQSTDSLEQLDELLIEIEKLKNIKFKTTEDKEAFDILLDIRTKLIESDKLMVENEEKYGERGSTSGGFGCKGGRPRILNSSTLRKDAALIGFEAVDSISIFVDEYPEHADKAALTMTRGYLLNVTFDRILKSANGDFSTLERLCSQEKYDELIKQDELKRQLLE